MPYKYRVDIDATFMRFDPSDLKFYKKICTDIPAFAAYKVHEEVVRIRLFAWIVCMYDQHTPLMKEVSDLYKRKVYAATLTGIRINKSTGKYKEYVEKILLGKDDEVNHLIVQYISSTSSPDYKQLIAHVTLQDTILKRIVSGRADKSDQLMFDTSTDVIKKLTNQLYGAGERDEVYEARRALYQQVTMDLNDMRPEAIAKKMSSGEGLPEEFSPYEDGYIPGDINFASDDPSIANEI